MSKKVLVLGANGKIGHHCCLQFEQQGWQVERFVRGTNMVEAAKDATIIVNGLNPPNYHNWDEIIPKITKDVIEAAKANDARVIIPGNVYNLDGKGGIWDENTLHAPVTNMGRIREDMEQNYRDNGVRTIILRAGNFIDPWAVDDVFKLMQFRTINKAKITSPAPPDIVQTYCYVPDWARCAVGLGEMEAQLSSFEDIPFEGYAFSSNELASIAGNMLGQKLTVSDFPWILFRITGPFWELARRMNEMRYLWQLPYRLDGKKLASLLPDFEPTPLEEAIQLSLDHIKSR